VRKAIVSAAERGLGIRSLLVLEVQSWNVHLLNALEILILV
jgi:hypothetical protein